MLIEQRIARIKILNKDAIQRLITDIMSDVRSRQHSATGVMTTRERTTNEAFLDLRYHQLVVIQSHLTILVR